MKLKNKLCVVGAGKWGMNHISTLESLNVLAGVVEYSHDILNKLRDQYPKLKLFDNLDDAINFDFDGFIVVTPPNTHYDVSKKIIRSKKHILIEKPFTTNFDNAKELYSYQKNIR